MVFQVFDVHATYSKFKPKLRGTLTKFSEFSFASLNLSFPLGLFIVFVFTDDNCVTLTEFEPSPAGMINSFTTRFARHDSVLEDLWKAEMPYHRL